MLGEAVAGAAVIGGLVALLAFLRKLRTDAHMRQAAKTRDVRSVVVEMRRLCQDVIAHGGLDTSHFLVPETQRNEQELRDLADAVVDEELGRLCLATYEAYKQLFAWAPPKLGPRIYVLEAPYPSEYAEEDRQRTERFTNQIEAARDCQVAIEATLQRVNFLEKRLRPS